MGERAGQSTIRHQNVSYEFDVFNEDLSVQTRILGVGNINMNSHAHAWGNHRLLAYCAKEPTWKESMALKYGIQARHGTARHTHARVH